MKGVPENEHFSRVSVRDNRGRNFMPFLEELRELFADPNQNFDYIAHVHGKKSSHNPTLGRKWRKRLMSFMASPRDFNETLQQMEKNNSGIAYADTSKLIPNRNMSWGQNEKFRDFLFSSCNLETLPLEASVLDFPAGGMFVLDRDTAGILADSTISGQDFCPENGALDGELHHGFERFLGELVHYQGKSHLKYLNHGRYEIITPPG
jgi:lipopolysaccharide biosynthesis protein